MRRPRTTTPRRVRRKQYIELLVLRDAVRRAAPVADVAPAPEAREGHEHRLRSGAASLVAVSARRPSYIIGGHEVVGHVAAPLARQRVQVLRDHPPEAARAGAVAPSN